MPFSHNGLKTSTGIYRYNVSQVNKYSLSYRFLHENVQGCVFAKNRPVSLNWTNYTISSIDKSIRRNPHRVLSPTHRRAIKEERKVANRDWVDHQACSLLQYINVIANIFIMGNYFNELR